MEAFISFFYNFATMDDNYFKSESPKKDSGFIWALVGLLLFSLMGIGIDYDEFSQHLSKDISIPSWYFYLIFIINSLIVSAILLIYFYKKIGVLLYPLATGAHFISHMYYLDTFLYSDVSALFVFVGIGLLAIIPKWQFFK